MSKVKNPYGELKVTGALICPHCAELVVLDNLRQGGAGDKPESKVLDIEIARQIIIDTAEKHGLSVAVIKGGARRGPIVRARHHAIYLVAKKTGLSLVAIGKVFGRDHSAIPYAIRAHEDRRLRARTKIIEGA